MPSDDADAAQVPATILLTPEEWETLCRLIADPPPWPPWLLAAVRGEPVDD